LVGEHVELAMGDFEVGSRVFVLHKFKGSAPAS
jgi:hypothetical protein